MGAFWGAPIVAGELEAKTHLLAWTQGVTRRHWLSVKLLLGGTVAAILAAGQSLASTWWAAPIDAAGSRIAPATFAQRGVAPIGYALFAIALGALAGAVLRRTLPATVDPDRALAACAHRLGIHSQDRIVPAGSFWHLKAAELVIFTALAALAAGATFWWLEHRID
jgi:hypothetical protein